MWVVNSTYEYIFLGRSEWLESRDDNKNKLRKLIYSDGNSSAKMAAEEL